MPKSGMSWRVPLRASMSALGAVLALVGCDVDLEAPGDAAIDAIDASVDSRDAAPAGDGGPPDAGWFSGRDAGWDAGWVPIDAGCLPSSCPAGERCVDGSCRCGTGPSCNPLAAYCYDGECLDRPTLVIETAEGDGCADLGLAYTPPAFLRRITIRGRPGAGGTLDAVRRGCPLLSTTSSFVLDDSGVLTVTEALLAPEPDCDDERVGLNQYVARIDGVSTTHAETIFFHSGCASSATCGLAQVLRRCTE